MKHAAIGLAFGTLCLVAQAALAQTPSAADAHAAHGHAHAADTGLSLNAGEPWQTDEPLRRGMLQIRVASAMLTPAFEAAQLSLPQSTQLAEAVRSSVNTMIAQCQLPPDADANLQAAPNRNPAHPPVLAKDWTFIPVSSVASLVTRPDAVSSLTAGSYRTCSSAVPAPGPTSRPRASWTTSSRWSPRRRRRAVVCARPHRRQPASAHR